MKHFLYIANLFLCLFLFTACEEEADDGAGSGGTGGGGGIYSNADFADTEWEQLDSYMAGYLTTNEDVEALDSWNEANGSITVNISTADGGATDVELTYINVEEDIDWNYEYDEETMWLEFEFSTISDWEDDDDMSSYSQLEIMCNANNCTTNTCTDCNMNFEGNWDDDEYTENIYFNAENLSFTWNPETFTFTFTEDFSFTDEWDGTTIAISEGSTISAETVEFSSGDPFMVAEEYDTTDPWQNSYIAFHADGTITDDYSVDCEQVPGDNEWDCYDEGCDVEMGGNGMWDDGESFVDENGNGMWDDGEDFDDEGPVLGCVNIDCSNFGTENECWDKDPCYWEYDDESCQSDNEDGGPGGWTWEVVDDQMILIAGDDMYYDDDMLPIMAFDISYDEDENLVLTQSMEMCSTYMGYLYYIYEYYFGFEWGTGPYADYYGDYFGGICDEIYEDISSDIYGLEANQIESAVQVQAITMAPYDNAPRVISGSEQRMHSPLIKPKLLRKRNIR